jgi:hypothetical protein
MHNPNKVGLVGAVLLGGWHVVWSVLVLTGVGQMIYDFVLWAHMLHIAVIVGPFDAQASATLIIMTAAFGYMLGYIGAIVWNKFHK